MTSGCSLSVGEAHSGPVLVQLYCVWGGCVFVGLMPKKTRIHAVCVMSGLKLKHRHATLKPELVRRVKVCFVILLQINISGQSFSSSSLFTLVQSSQTLLLLPVVVWSISAGVKAVYSFLVQGGDETV